MKTPTKIPIFPQIDGQANTDPAAFPQTTLRFGQTESKIHVGDERTEQMEKPQRWSREEAFPSRKWIVRPGRRQRPQFQVRNHWPETRTELSSKTKTVPSQGLPRVAAGRNHQEHFKNPGRPRSHHAHQTTVGRGCWGPGRGCKESPTIPQRTKSESHRPPPDRKPERARQVRQTLVISCF